VTSRAQNEQSAHLTGAFSQFVAQAQHSHFMQDPIWAECFSEDKREYCRGVTTFDSSARPQACSLVRVVQNRFGVLAKAFVDGGPVFDCVGDLQSHLTQIEAAADDCTWLRIRPYIWRDEGAELRDILLDRGYRFASDDMCSWYSRTAVLDLSASLQSIHSGFASALRRNLKRAERASLSVEQVVQGEDIDQFANLLLQSAQIGGYSVPKAQAVAQYLRATLSRDQSRAALFVSKSGARVQAGIVVLPAGRAAVYHWGARDRASDSTLPLTHLLHWAGIRWAQQCGFAFYDFGGLNGAAAWNGIDRFKLSFGCVERALLGEATLTIRPFAARTTRVMYSIASRLRVVR
jgi:lipid II:glycine glycyltransferase (peptidoglycan interpeptide bridge formation enzyme)